MKLALSENVYGLVPDHVINMLMNIAPSSGCLLEPYNLLLKVSESYFCDFSEKVFITTNYKPT